MGSRKRSRLRTAHQGGAVDRGPCLLRLTEAASVLGLAARRPTFRENRRLTRAEILTADYPGRLRRKRFQEFGQPRIRLRRDYGATGYADGADIRNTDSESVRPAPNAFRG
jgi:hypothetical protein